MAIGGGSDPVVGGGLTAAVVDEGDGARILGFGDLIAAAELPFPSVADAPDLVAQVLGEVMAAAGAVATHTVLAHPAVYGEHQIAALRRALTVAGLDDVELVAEPIAAAAALDTAAGVPNSAMMLVYDLGATSLDLTVLVRDRRGHRIAGRPARSYAFGGRCTAATVAAAEHDLAPTDEPAARLPEARVAEVRTQLVLDSVPLVHECLCAAGVSGAQLGAVLLTGGAATPGEVAHTLADALCCPVVRGSVPAESVARGAALLGAGRAAADTVLVPVRRPRSRHALVVAAITVPLLIPAALGLLRADGDGRGAVVAAPGRALPALPSDSPIVEPVSLPDPVGAPTRPFLAAPGWPVGVPRGCDCAAPASRAGPRRHSVVFVLHCSVGADCRG